MLRAEFAVGLGWAAAIAAGVPWWSSSSRSMAHARHMLLGDAPTPGPPRQRRRLRRRPARRRPAGLRVHRRVRLAAAAAPARRRPRGGLVNPEPPVDPGRRPPARARSRRRRAGRRGRERLFAAGIPARPGRRRTTTATRCGSSTSSPPGRRTAGSSCTCGSTARARRCRPWPRLSFPASRFEREIADLFGIIPRRPPPSSAAWSCTSTGREGWHPMRHDAGPPPPMLADAGPFPFVPVEGAGVYEIPVGPVHAGLIEPGPLPLLGRRARRSCR